MEKKILAIVQARLASKRLPNKVLLNINGQNALQNIYSRLQNSKFINQIVFATTNLHSDDKLSIFFKKNDFLYHRGPSQNVYKRYVETAKKFKADIIVRLTGDCPLIDVNIVDKVIQNFLNNQTDYSSNLTPPTYPNGLDVEVFSRKLLEKSFKKLKSDFDKEHVTTFFRRSKLIKKVNLLNNINLSNVRLTLDDYEDYKNIVSIFKFFKNKKNFSIEKIMDYLNKNRKKYNIIRKRNDFADLGAGQKLWKKAKTIIPGGNMLISKRSEFFLPDLWPSYYSKSKKCFIWDLDNKKLTDMSLMGVGTNILGYAYTPVDNEVIKSIKFSNMSTLNCPEEVQLAEKLIDMNNWADMVKFAKTGAEANAIAIRIARSYSKRDNIAICGYHGWHDWYLSSNLNKKENLSNHLLQGLYTSGVPKKLKNTVFPFNYNDFNNLQKIIKEKDIGVIKMEVIRNVEPDDDFIYKIRDICNKKNIVLIFDECTSGFRKNFGGYYKNFNINPDMITYGKAIANGYPLTSIVGKRNIMEHANQSFISSTFWTDRIGYVASLKTLKEMEKVKSWITISKIGRKIKNKWLKLANKYELNIDISGIDALPIFRLPYKNWLKYKTYITQCMLEKNILATNSIYVCIYHDDKRINHYFNILDKIFFDIKKFEEGENIDYYLKTNISQSSFQRLN